MKYVIDQLHLFRGFEMRDQKQHMKCFNVISKKTIENNIFVINSYTI